MEFHKYRIFIKYLISGFRVGKEVFKVGLNHGFVGKPADPVGMGLGKGWLPSAVTQQQLIEHVAREGHAFTAHYKGGHRKTTNFICSDFIAADIDRGMTLDEALAIPFVQQYASFIYTTPSHTDDDHRFRIVFLLEDTITVAADWANALFGLALKLDSDLSSKDAARMYYGCIDARVIDLGNLLPANEVDALIAAGGQERKRNSGRNSLVQGYALTSSLKIQPGQLITTADGSVVPFEEIPRGTDVCCPFHHDTNPSAFVVQSNSGITGINCRVCNVSFWPEKPRPYDFNSFNRLVREKAGEDVKRAEAQKRHPNLLERYFPPKPQVQVIQTKFLPKLDYQPGITLVKSPKGSGKTEAIAALVEQIRSGMFVGGKKAKDKPTSVLLIGHRRSLIREAANRLGLDCYLDDEDFGTHRRKRFGYAICLDSLHKIALAVAKPVRAKPAIKGPPPQYDVVIIDESEQVISHLLSETLRERSGMVEAFGCLDRMIRRAKAVVALDADLGLITAHAMRDYRRDDWTNNCRIILNKPMPVENRREMVIYQSEIMLRERMLDAIRDGKRVFVASNSKDKVEVLAQLIRNEFGPDLAMMAITSLNSHGDEESFFVQNIQTEFLKKQVLLCSPSLGTGIDITFPDGACKVDEVIGFFSPHVNTHSDIDQQLCRVRNPGAVSVWFEGAQLDFETSFDVIREQLAASGFVPSARIGSQLDDDENPTFNLDDPLLKIATHVKVAERSSKREIKRLFTYLREENGWDVKTVEKPEKPKKDTKFATAQGDVKERRILSLLNARDIDEEEFKVLRKLLRGEKKITKDDRDAMEKYRLAKSYGRQVDRDLIERDKKGKLREQCQVYRNIFRDGTFTTFLAGGIRDDLNAGKPIKENPLWWVVGTIMIAVGLIEDGKLNRKAVVRSDQLGSFVTLCVNNRVLIEDKFGKPLRKDLEEKPVTTLNEFLDKAGVKLISAGRKVRGGSSGNDYKIDLDQLSLVEDIALSIRDILQQNSI